VLVEETGQTCLAESDADGDEAHTLRPLQAAAITYRIAFGPRAGHKALNLRGAMPRDAAPWRSCAPTSTASACMRPCVEKRMTASSRSSCAHPFGAFRRAGAVQCRRAGVRRCDTPANRVPLRDDLRLQLEQAAAEFRSQTEQRIDKIFVPAWDG
jgi:hypothetical protein